MGESGAGKSTLLHLLGGLERPQRAKSNTAGEETLRSWTTASYPTSAIRRLGSYGRTPPCSRSFLPSKTFYAPSDPRGSRRHSEADRDCLSEGGQAWKLGGPIWQASSPAENSSASVWLERWQGLPRFFWRTSQPVALISGLPKLSRRCSRPCMSPTGLHRSSLRTITCSHNSVTGS